MACLVTSGLFLIVLGCAWILIPFAIRKRAEKQLQALCHRERAIVLTYDDGPGEILTGKLLDLLKARGVAATFFALGRNAVARPDVLQRLIHDGHDLGSHTFDHSNAWKTWPWRTSPDIARGIAVVQAAGGNSLLFRPPFGKMTLLSFLQCRKMRLQNGWWTVDSRDSWQRRPIAEVVTEIDAKGGGIVLMHDYDHYEKAPATPSHVEHALALTEAVIDLARRKNFRIMSMTGLLALQKAGA